MQTEDPWMEKARAELAALQPSQCPCCGEDYAEDFSPNVEAFEICGEAVCDDCAEQVFEDNGQFGAGA